MESDRLIARDLDVLAVALFELLQFLFVLQLGEDATHLLARYSRAWKSLRFAERTFLDVFLQQILLELLHGGEIILVGGLKHAHIRLHFPRQKERVCFPNRRFVHLARRRERLSHSSQQWKRGTTIRSGW